MTPAELRALVDAATPGPWNHDGDRIRDPEVRFVAETVNEEDARLIALAPDLARLCADIAEALERILKPWEKTQGQGGPLAVAANEALAPARAALTKLSELNP